MKFGMQKDEFSLEDSSKNESSNVSHLSSVLAKDKYATMEFYLTITSCLSSPKVVINGEERIENCPLSALLNWRTRSKVLGDFKEVILNSSHRVQKWTFRFGTIDGITSGS